MNTRTIRELRILLPDIDRDDLSTADLPRPGDTVTDALVTGDSWRRAQLDGLTVSRSRFDTADLADTVWQECTLTGTEIHHTDLTGATLADTALDRCLIRGCRLTGAQLTKVTIKNTIFENCRLDYTTLDQLRTTGPLAIIGCTLAESTLTRCQLTQVALDDCQLRHTELHHCDLRGADLRDIDLSDIRGATNLRGATINQTQLSGLANALAHDLELVIT